MGQNEKTAQEMINAGRDFRDTYLLSPNSILATEKARLLLMNSQGQTKELYKL